MLQSIRRKAYYMDNPLQAKSAARGWQHRIQTYAERRITWITPCKPKAQLGADNTRYKHTPKGVLHG